jgi:hypothetical protein
MDSDFWLVQIEMDGPVRAKMIEALEQVIAHLREQEPLHPSLVSKETESYPYGLPTIIYANVDDSVSLERRILKLFCYRDRRDFIRLLKQLEKDET